MVALGLLPMEALEDFPLASHKPHLSLWPAVQIQVRLVQAVLLPLDHLLLRPGRALEYLAKSLLQSGLGARSANSPQ